MRLICFFLALAPLFASGQTLGDYRSFQSGPWSTASSWARFDGSVWVNPAPAPPSSATAGVVTIRITHTITVTATQDTDETVVQTGGTLTINSGQVLTIADGNLTDLSNSGTITSSAEADLVFSNSASYAHARNGGTIPLATWNSGSTCSITGVTNTVPGGLNPSGGFFHFVWNSPQLVPIDLGGNLVDVNGNFSLLNSNGTFLRMSTSTSPVIDIDGDLVIDGPLTRFSFTTTGSPTIDVGGDFIHTATHASGSILSGSGSFNLTVHGDLDVNSPGGILSFSNGGGNGVINLDGDFTLTAGTITETVGTGTFNFTKTGTQTFVNTGTLSAIIHYTVGANSVLDVAGESLLSGTGTFTLNGGIRLGSLNTLGALVLGAGSGNVRTSGRVFNAGAKVTYAGVGAQFIGSGHPTSATVETEIDNASGVTFNTTTSGNSGGNNLIIAGVLRLTNGDLNIVSSGGVARHLNFSGSIVDNGNSITVAGTTTDLTIGGTGALGTFPLPSGASTIRTFTVNRTAGSVDFADSLSATGVTTLQNGTMDFNAGASLSGGLALSAGTTVFFEGQGLSIGGNFTTAGGVISGDLTSVLTLTGSAAFTSPLAFSPTGNDLQTLVLNKSNAGNSVTINATLNISNALTLTDGQLNIVGSTLMMAAGADLTRNSNASIATSSPGGGPWDLIYEGDSQTTGLEIPATGSLASLTVNANNAAVVTLAQAITASGALTITSSGRTLTSATNNVTAGSVANSGTFNAPTSAAGTGLTLNGNFVNDGTFNNNTGTVVIGASVAMSGTSINTTNFNNITISGAGNLTAPANLIVQGNFTNNGTFTAGSGTVVFNGSVGSKTLSGTSDSQFNNFTLNKLNAGLSLTVSSTQTVNGALTLTAGQMSIVASQLLLLNGASIVKNSSSSITTSSPGGGPWHLTYVSGTQNTSLEIPTTGSLLSLTISVDDARTVTLTQAVTVSGAMSIPLAGRTFTSGANDVTLGSLSISGLLNAPSSSATTGLTLNGNFANAGTFANAAGTVIVNGASVFSGSSMDGTLFNHVTISGTLTPTATLNVQGSFINNGAFVAGLGTVNFSGATGGRVLSGTTNTSFNNLVLNKSNVGTSVTVSSAQTVAGTLTLTQGQLAITTSNLQMGSGATLIRNSTASITSTSPGGGPYNLSYVGASLSSGLEIPATSLASLTVNSNNAAVVTLTTAAAVTGAFTNGLAGRSFTCGNNDLTVGTFSNAGTFTAPSAAATTGLTLNGNFVNDGTFTHNSGTMVVNGASTLSGTVIDATLFNAITISGTGTLTPSPTLNIQGNFTNNGSFVVGSGTVNFSGMTGARVLSGTTNTSFNNLVLNKSNAGTSLTVSSTQTVAGTLTLTQGQLAITGSNLQMGNGATLIRNPSGTITSTSPGGGPYHLSYVGASMSTGLEIPATNLASLTVNSNNAAVITLTTAASVAGAFTNGLSGRSFTCGNNNLTAGTLSNAGTFTSPSASATTGLTLNGNFVNDGTFNNNSGTVIVNGASTLSGTTIDAVVFNNITISGTGALTPSTTLNVQGNFANNGSFVAGSGTVNFSGAAGGRVLSGTTNSSFNNLVLNKSNVGTSLTVSSAQTVAGTLTLTLGQLAITTSNLQMGNGATLIRNSTASITSSSPGGGPYHLSYVGGSMSTGLEIPATSLASLTVNSNNAAVITLTTAATVTGAFTNGLAGRSFTCGGNNLTVGTFSNAGTFTASSAAATSGLTLNGNFVNDGTFTNNSGTIRAAGTVAMSGTAINTTDFRTIIITGSLTPPSTLNVQGSFTNNGTFVAGSGTVNFSGTTGGMTLSGTTNTSFNNLILAKSNAGVSVTVSSAQTVANTLTLTQGQLSISSSSLQLSSGATLIRNPSGSIVSSSPGGGPYNLSYAGGSLTTGLEIPTGNLQSLTVNSSSAAVITLGSNASMVGALTINTQAVGPTFTSGNRTISAGSVANGGIFDAPTPAALTLTGNLTNDGTFNRGAGTVIFAGTSTIAGTNNPTLHHATITGTLTSPAILLLTGTFTNNGTFNANGGTVTFNGTTAQSIAGSSTTLFKHINANNTAGVNVNGTGNLGGVLTLAAGVQFDADGTGSGVFTVLSLDDNPTADGSITTIPGTSSVTGAVTVQRYMRAKGQFNRYISPPVSNTTAAGLSDDFNIDGIRYYDETVLGTASLGYTYIGDVGPLTPGRGYLAFMWDGASNITWDLRGPMTANQNQGAVDLNVTHTLSSPADPNSDGWNLVGNPYPSGIVWDNGAGWTKTDIAPIISVPDPAAGSGVFRTWNADTQSGDLPGGIVTMGQAFWVYANLPGASLIVNESAKTSAAGTFYRERRPDPVSTLTLSLTHKDITDNSFITIQPNATDDYDVSLDGPKFPGEFYIATTGKSGRHMVFNAVSGVDDSWLMPIYVNGEEGAYAMNFSNQYDFKRYEDLYLVDAHEGRSMKISGMSNYEFEISADKRSSENRFYLTLRPEGLPIMDEGEQPTVVAYPNPVFDVITVEITGHRVEETVLLNEVGGLVSRISMTDEGRKHSGTVDMGGQSSGLYVVKALVDGRVIAIKVIKN